MQLSNENYHMQEFLTMETQIDQCSTATQNIFVAILNMRLYQYIKIVDYASPRCERHVPPFL